MIQELIYAVDSAARRYGKFSREYQQAMLAFQRAVHAESEAEYASAA